MIRFYIFFVALIASIALLADTQLYALNIDRLSGRILLQVESKGEAWYIDPVSNQRVYLGRPTDAFEIMRSFGLGITDNDLDRIATSDEQQTGDEKFTRRLAGKIVLQIQSRGEAWYINPMNLRRYFLGRPADAFSVMRTLGLGVSNNNIKEVPTYGTEKQPVTQPAEQTAIPSTPNSQPSTKQGAPKPAAETSTKPSDSKRLSGSYRCWSYNVSGGGGGDCRLFAPIVLNTDGTYSMSSEKGTYRIEGSTINLSESKIRGSGSLNAEATQIRFEYDYNNWHHVITYLKESGAASSSTESGAEAAVYLTLEYPEKNSSLGSITTVELVPEGQNIGTTSYKPTAIAVWGGDKRVTASFHKPTNTPKTGQKYTVYTSYGGDAVSVGTLDLTKVTKEITTTINVSTGKVDQETVQRPEGPEIVVEIDLVYSSQESSLGSIQFVVLVPEGQDPITAVYKPMALAVWDGEKTIVGSFHKATNQVKTKAKYDVYADWGPFGGYVKSGTLDLMTTTEGPVKKTYQTTTAGLSQSSSSTSSDAEASSPQSQTTATSSPAASTPTYVAVNVILQFPTGDSSLNNVTRIAMIKQGEVYYEGYSGEIAGYGANQQLTASFSSIQPGALYDVYTQSYSAGSKKVGVVDMRGVSSNTTKTVTVQ